MEVAEEVEAIWGFDSLPDLWVRVLGMAGGLEPRFLLVHLVGLELASSKAAGGFESWELNRGDLERCRR